MFERDFQGVGSFRQLIGFVSSAACASRVGNLARPQES